MQRTATYLNGDIEMLAPENGHLGQIIGAFSAESRAQFIRMAQIRTVRARMVLVTSGMESAEIGFVLSGTLAMTKHLADGRVSIGGLLLPSNMYGQLFSGPSEYHIEALSDAHVLCFKRATFQSLLLREPEAVQKLLAHVYDDLAVAREWTLLLNGAEVISRVASFLAILVRRNGSRLARSRQPVSVQVDLSREDLASYLGTRPETLSRAFHKLADKKIIRILGPFEFEILDLPALLDVSGQDLILSEGA